LLVRNVFDLTRCVPER